MWRTPNNIGTAEPRSSPSPHIYHRLRPRHPGGLTPIARPTLGVSREPYGQSLSEILLRGAQDAAHRSIAPKATALTTNPARGSCWPLHTAGAWPRGVTPIGDTRHGEGTRLQRSALEEPLHAAGALCQKGHPHCRSTPWTNVRCYETLPSSNTRARRSNPFLLQGLSIDLC